MMLCGVNVGLSVRVVDPATATAGYDTAVYDRDVYDGGAEAWLDINPETMRSAHTTRVNEPSDFRAELYDPTRRLDPTFSPYAPALGEGCRFRLTVDGVALWSGSAGPEGWAYDVGDYTASVTGLDALSLMAGWAVVDAPFPRQSTAARVAAVAALPPAPPALTLTGSGVTLGPLSMSGDTRSMLDAVNGTEVGAYWTRADGAVVYRCRDAIDIHPATVWDVYDVDAGDGTYESLSLGAPPAVNTVLADRIRPDDTVAPRIYLVDASRARYGPRALTHQALQFDEDSDVTEWAQLHLARGAWPATGPTRAVFRLRDGLTYAERTVATLLAVQPLDGVRVHLTARGPEQTWDLVVAGVTHDISPDEWVVTLDLDPGWDIPGSGDYDATTSLYDFTRYAYA